MSLPHLQTALERSLSTVSATVAHILDRAVAGVDITVDEATSLFDADGSDLPALTAAADYLRAKTVGDTIEATVRQGSPEVSAKDQHGGSSTDLNQPFADVTG